MCYYESMKHKQQLRLKNTFLLFSFKLKVFMNKMI